MRRSYLVTCEHASYKAPRFVRDHWTPLFLTDKGWDEGAFLFAQSLSKTLSCPLLFGSVSRLLIDLNRSLEHPKLFACSSLSESQKKKLILNYWKPFRDKTISHIERLLKAQSPVIHISCHTFTPIFCGKKRACDIGLLYDPSRKKERQFAQALKALLSHETSARIRMNYPYRGTSDGHTTSLRERFSDAEYIGLEVEVNQALIKTDYWKYVVSPALVRAITLL